MLPRSQNTLADIEVLDGNAGAIKHGNFAVRHPPPGFAFNHLTNGRKADAIRRVLKVTDSARLFR